MKQTIEIEVPDGKKAVWKDGKVVFEDIKPQLPKTWEEFCITRDIKMNEYFIGETGKIFNSNTGKRIPDISKTLLPSEEAAKAHLALMQLHQLRDCYRQGWKPNWSDNCNNKYGIKWNTIAGKVKLDIAWCKYNPIFFSFPTDEIASEFLTNFRELIEEAGDLI